MHVYNQLPDQKSQEKNRRTQKSKRTITIVIMLIVLTTVFNIRGLEQNNLDFNKILLNIVITITTIKSKIKQECKQITEEKLDIRIIKMLTTETRFKNSDNSYDRKRDLMKMKVMTE